MKGQLRYQNKKIGAMTPITSSESEREALKGAKPLAGDPYIVSKLGLPSYELHANESKPQTSISDELKSSIRDFPDYQPRAQFEKNIPSVRILKVQRATDVAWEWQREKKSLPCSGAATGYYREGRYRADDISEGCSVLRPAESLPWLNAGEHQC